MDYPTLDSLSARPDFVAVTAAEREQLRAFWGSHSPELDLEPGTISDLIIRPGAEAAALNKTRIDFLQLTRSLYELVQNPELDTEERVDWILQNFPGYSRRARKVAAGQAVVIRATDQIVSIPSGSTFTVNGLTYYTTQTYVATPYYNNPRIDRLIVARDDGTFSFTVPLRAVAGGEQYNIRSGTELTWSANVKHLKVYAESDFSGGADAETTAEIAAKMDEIMALPAMAGRMNIASLIRKEFEAAVRDISQIGGWDPEMQRDGYNPLGLKTGGRTDIYVKTADSMVTKSFEVPGRLVDPATYEVQLHVGRDVYPGFYTINAVRRLQDGPDEPDIADVSLQFGMDTSGFDYDVPRMRSVLDSRYTRYQTVDIRFIDQKYTPGTVYVVTCWGVPLIAEIQDFVAQRTIRKPNGDVLIKAAIPFLVGAGVTVEYLPGAETIDTKAVREAALNAISSATFRDGKLLTTTISSSVQKVLPINTKVLPPVDLLGVLYPPDDTLRHYRSTNRLVVDDDYDQCISPRTVAFYPHDVYVYTTPSKGPQV